MARVEGLQGRPQSVRPKSSSLKSTTHQGRSGWRGGLELCIRGGPTPEGRRRNLWFGPGAGAILSPEPLL